MAKITKKQKAIIESCREEIYCIIAGSVSLAVENKYDDSKIAIRSIYDSSCILNIIQDKLDKL